MAVMLWPTFHTHSSAQQRQSLQELDSEVASMMDMAEKASPTLSRKTDHATGEQTDSLSSSPTGSTEKLLQSTATGVSQQ